jgi:hypothetical protein
MMVDYWDPMVFLTVLIYVFSLLLVIAGIFTAYFGSGKSRKIGAGLLVAGLVIGIIWAYLISQSGPLDQGAWGNTDIIVQTIGVLLAAIIGAGIAVGLFLLAIMKS